MKYELMLQGSPAAEPVVSEDLENHLAAIEWARDWVKSHAEHDRYKLQRIDGGRPTLMIRTVAGQWYAMALPDETMRPSSDDRP